MALPSAPSSINVSRSISEKGQSLLVLDRHGWVLADSYSGDRNIGLQVALQGLARLLKTGLAR